VLGPNLAPIAICGSVVFVCAWVIRHPPKHALGGFILQLLAGALAAWAVAATLALLFWRD